MARVSALAGDVEMAKALKSGVVFVVITDEVAAEVQLRVRQAAEEVPDGRVLFVLWNQSDDWNPSVPIESVAVSTVLREPNSRENSNWDFYGCGAVRLYRNHDQRPTKTVLWTGFRRKGEKAYLRNRGNQLPKTVIKSSKVPVSDKVFTRDVANNVWHMTARGGVDSVISRLQSLTTWSDEIAVVFVNGSKRRRKHRTLRLEDNLVPVANKTDYVLPGFRFAQSGKPTTKVNNQLPLF